jgi:hypothetical protein
LCGAERSARFSNLLRCGAAWVLMVEHCPSLGWDFSCEIVGSSCWALWDVLAAGISAGRFGGDAWQACQARVVALSRRPGHTGRVAAALHLPGPPVV